MPDQSSPRRRFQFRLRTLMIVVTLVAVAVGIAVWIVGEARKALEREALLENISKHGGDYQPFLFDGPSVSLVRRWYHDRAIAVIWLPAPDQGVSSDRIRAVFPESQILR